MSGRFRSGGAADRPGSGVSLSPSVAQRVGHDRKKEPPRDPADVGPAADSVMAPPTGRKVLDLADPPDDLTRRADPTAHREQQLPMTVPNLTPKRESPEDPSRGFVPVRELVEQLMGGLPSAAAVERQGRADPIEDWEFHGPAPHSAAPHAPAAAEAVPLPKAEAAADAGQLAFALDEDARPGWPACRYSEYRGLHHRHWKAARRAPWLQVNAENSLAALAYMDVARSHYEVLLADWLPPATWTVVDGRGRLSVAWALRSGVHWNRGSWAWRRRKARTVDQELALALGAVGQIGRNIDAPIARRLHANPTARPSPWQHVGWTGERYRLQHLDSRSKGSAVVTAGGPQEAVGRAVGGVASGSARQVIAAERRALVADLVGKGLSTREIAAVVEVRTGRKVTPRTVRTESESAGGGGTARAALVTGK